jgi:leucyl-tRNA synthetase
VLFFDQVFDSQINSIIHNTENGYENLVIREVVKEAFYRMNSIREEYKISCSGFGMKKSLVKKWIRNQLILLCPITPHFCEAIYQEIKEKIKMENDPMFAVDLQFPVQEPEDKMVIQKYSYVTEVGKNLRSTHERFQKKNS